MTGCIIDSTQFRYTRQAKYVAFLFGCEGIHLEYPAKTVLGNVTLGVHEGDRIGIVGQNGDGKSTLLGVLAGLVEPDEGLVRHTRGLRIGMLGQRDSLEDEASVEYAVVGDTPNTSGPATRACARLFPRLIRGYRTGCQGEDAFGRTASTR